MRPRRRGAVFSAALMIAASMACVASVYNLALHGRVIDRLDQIERNQEDDQMLTEKWISGGNEFTWTTTWDRDDETLDEFITRHKAEVADVQGEFKPDD